MLNNKQIKNFINYYGAGDFYAFHERKPDGSIVVTYFPSLQKVMDRHGLKKIASSMDTHKWYYEKYFNQLVIKDGKATIISNHEFVDRTLEKNFPLFLKELKKNQIQPKYEAL